MVRHKLGCTSTEATVLKFWMKEVEGLCYLSSENKGADQLEVSTQLICAFVFAYANSWFSHDKISRCC